ncbi:YraN family protein [Allorhizobium undicola]|uniref:YraN family protein n=1 Tax=Allorhizobium undicola TaxID=78527 RepID=UPI0004834A33|nr:YraN family protein [Allorhizobium undicola]
MSGRSRTTGSRQDRRRRKAEKRGRMAEWLAVAFLLMRGYRILALRHKTRFGEVDIIARKGDLVALVEVKARASEQLALDAVSHESQRRIRAAGDAWLSRQKQAHLLSIRCDIIAVMPWRLPRHFENAF